MAIAHLQRGRNNPISVMQGQKTLQPYMTQPSNETQRIERGTKPPIGTYPGVSNPNTVIGTTIEHQPNDHTLRVYHQNIRGAKVYNTWNRWTEGIKQLEKWNVGVALLAETNTNWTNNNIQDAKQRAKLATRNLHPVQKPPKMITNQGGLPVS
jgi:hypothetical protein